MGHMTTTHGPCFVSRNDGLPNADFTICNTWGAAGARASDLTRRDQQLMVLDMKAFRTFDFYFGNTPGRVEARANAPTSQIAKSPIWPVQSHVGLNLKRTEASFKLTHLGRNTNPPKPD